MYPSQEYLRSILDYDPDTGLFVWRIRSDVPKEWNTRRAGKCAGCPDHRGYLFIGVNGCIYYAHRLAWLWMRGECPPDDIDHRDTDKANNKWENLRRGSRSENCANQKASKRNTSGFKGVSLYKKMGTWRAQIMVRRENIHLGYFLTKEAAREAYNKAAKSYFGVFAREA